MNWLIVVQSACGLILIAAALGKAGRRGSLRPFLEALGVPEPVARLHWAVPVVEGSVGLSLILWPGSVATVAFTALSFSFVIATSIALIKKVEVGCRCLGALDTDSPMGPVSLARAGILAVVSTALVVAYLSEASRWTGNETASAHMAGGLSATVYLVVFALIGQVYMFETKRWEMISGYRRTNRIGGKPL